MRLLLMLILGLFLLNLWLALGSYAQRKWPDPPSWWLHSAQMTCVRWRESANGVTSRNIYELEGPQASGNYGDYAWLDNASRAEQDYRAWLLWRSQGCHRAWGVYDGCC
jgi:hypothetical protein